MTRFIKIGLQAIYSIEFYLSTIYNQGINIR